MICEPSELNSEPSDGFLCPRRETFLNPNLKHGMGEVSFCFDLPLVVVPLFGPINCGFLPPENQSVNFVPSSPRPPLQPPHVCFFPLASLQELAEAEQCSSHHQRVLGILRHKNPDVSQKAGPYKVTPLHSVAYRGWADVAALLLQAKVPIKIGHLGHF